MSLLGRLWAMRRERPVFVAVSLGTLAVLAVYPLVDWQLRTAGIGAEFLFRDFGAYNAAVERWRAGEALYRRTPEDGFWGSYLYPPVVVLLFLPFTAPLPFRPAAMAWVATTALLLWLGLQALVAALGYHLRWYERLGLGWLVAGFHPVLLAAMLGQTALLAGGLLSFAGAALVRDPGPRVDAGTGAHGSAAADDDGSHASAWALGTGAATAVVGVVKLAYAPVGAHLLHDRRRLRGALLVVPPVAWLSVRFFGVAAHRTYLDVLLWGVRQGSGPVRSPTLWLPAYYKPLAWMPRAQTVRVGVCLAVVGLALLAEVRARRLVFALGLATFPLVAPQTYTYYLVALLPAVVVLLVEEIERDGYPVVPVLGLLFAHLHAYGLKFLVDVLPGAVAPLRALRPVFPLAQPGLWGTALLVGLAAFRVAQSVPGLASQSPAADPS